MASMAWESSSVCIGACSLGKGIGGAEGLNPANISFAGATGAALGGGQEVVSVPGKLG